MSALIETIQRPKGHMRNLPDSTTHFKREIIDFKSRHKVFAKSEEERDQLKRAKKNKNTLRPRDVVMGYLNTGSVINLPVSRIRALR